MSTATRLTVSSPDRANETTAALDLVAGRPLAGVGPGRASLRWTNATGDVMSPVTPTTSTCTAGTSRTIRIEKA